MEAMLKLTNINKTFNPVLLMKIKYLIMLI